MKGFTLGLSLLLIGYAVRAEDTAVIVDNVGDQVRIRADSPELAGDLMTYTMQVPTDGITIKPVTKDGEAVLVIFYSEYDKNPSTPGKHPAQASCYRARLVFKKDVSNASDLTSQDVSISSPKEAAPRNLLVPRSATPSSAPDPTGVDDHEKRLREVENRLDLILKELAALKAK